MKCNSVYEYVLTHPIAAISWSDIANSNPIEDLREYQRMLGYRYGIYGNKIKISERIFRLIENNKLCLQYNDGIPIAIGELSKFLWGPDTVCEFHDKDKVICEIDGYRKEGRNYLTIEATVI